MKVLIANYRYFVSGGPERYMFNVTDALRKRGHEVVPFSVRYRQNEPTHFSSYFVPPLGSENQVYFNEQKMSPITLGKTLSRLFFSPEVARAVRRLVADTRPDVAYVLHYLRKLSPSLLVALKEEGIPIVVRLSDYQMLCPQTHFLRDEQPCQLCSGSNLWPSIYHKCVKDSLSASALNALATWFHEAKHYFDLIDRFVVTNPFMLKAMLDAGYASERLALVPTFVQPQLTTEELIELKRDQVAFVGRLEHIKGAHVLIEAAGILISRFPEVGWYYRIAGEGSPEYVAMLHRRVRELNLSERVELCGSLDRNDVFDLLAISRVQVIPSLWFENLPNSLLEGFASCTPAVVSRLGSLAAAIEEGKTGLLFTPGDAESLAHALFECWTNRDRLVEMGRTARLRADTIYSEQGHLEKLTSLFSTLVRSK